MKSNRSKRSSRAYLTAATDQPRARRAADVTTLAVGLVFVAWGLLAFDKADPTQQALTQFAAALPNGRSPCWRSDTHWASSTPWLSWSCSWCIDDGRPYGDVLSAGILASIVTLVLIAVYDHLWPPFFIEFVQGPARRSSRSCG